MTMRLAAICMMTFAATSSAAATCPRPGSLGTSRTLVVDPAGTPQIALKSFPQTLPLADKEVVLTFDDGPYPPTTRRVLAALAQECVKATFFLIGKTAAANPVLVQRIAAEGHTIGHHSYSHPNMARITPELAIYDIERGIAADEMALNGRDATTPTTPFFRFPYFESTPALLDLMRSRRIAVFGADLWASDWNEMTPQQELALIAERLDHAGKGIILFHDTKARTAAMMPDFLRYLRLNDYRIVHVVAASPPQQAGR